MVPQLPDGEQHWPAGQANPFVGPHCPFGDIGLPVEVGDPEAEVVVVVGGVPPAHMPYAGLQF